MTQDECKQRFFELCEEFSKNITEIDNQTPWSETEPSWWLEMREIQKHVLTFTTNEKLKRIKG